jgi:hypothetical protein
MTQPVQSPAESERKQRWLSRNIVGQSAFVVSLMGALVLFITALAVRMAEVEAARVTLAVLAITGAVAMFVGILVYVFHVLAVNWERRSESTNENTA